MKNYMRSNDRMMSSEYLKASKRLGSSKNLKVNSISLNSPNKSLTSSVLNQNKGQRINIGRSITPELTTSSKETKKLQISFIDVSNSKTPADILKHGNMSKLARSDSKNSLSSDRIMKSTLKTPILNLKSSESMPKGINISLKVVSRNSKQVSNNNTIKSLKSNYVKKTSDISSVSFSDKDLKYYDLYK